MAIQHHSTAFGPRTITLGLAAHDRKAIERQIEALIALLDEYDGDPDLEDGDEDSDGLERGEHPGHANGLPIYGLDQSVGPLNQEIESLLAT